MKVVSGVYPYGSYDGEFFYKGEECRFHNIRESEQQGHRHHPPGAGAHPPSLDHREHLPGQRADRPAASSSGARRTCERDRAAQEGRARRVAGHPDPPDRRRQAAARRDRQGAVEERRPADPRRADLVSLNEADSQKLLQPPARVPRPRASPASSSRTSSRRSRRSPTRSRSCATARSSSRSTRTDGSVSEDRIIRGMVGRDMTHRFPPREAEIGEVVFEVRNWKVAHPIYDGPDGHQRRQHQRPGGRGRRHRRPDGRRADRVRDERLRTIVGPLRRRARCSRTARRSTSARSRRRSRTGSRT